MSFLLKRYIVYLFIYMKSSFAKTDKRHFPKKWTLNTFSQKSLYCPLSMYREFPFHLYRSRQAPLLFLWTEADKSILANQHAVFRSGDMAFTLKRRASWEEFRQCWLKVIETRIDHFDEPVISSSGRKRKIKTETFSWNFEKWACYNAERKAIYMNEWWIYNSALLCIIVVHPKCFTIMWGGGWFTTTCTCDGYCLKYKLLYVFFLFTLPNLNIHQLPLTHK